MYDKLTRGDLEQMKKELDYRRITLRPQLLEAVKEARAFGDLSENFEYKAAKKEKNANESRIRYLERMMETAVLIEDTSAEDEIGLYDRVTVFCSDIDEEEVYQIVTTMRENTLKGLISRESPVGRALLGHRAGDTVTIHAGNGYSYEMEIRKVEKGTDDGSIPIARF